MLCVIISCYLNALYSTLIALRCFFVAVLRRRIITVVVCLRLLWEHFDLRGVIYYWELSYNMFLLLSLSLLHLIGCISSLRTLVARQALIRCDWFGLRAYLFELQLGDLLALLRSDIHGCSHATVHWLDVMVVVYDMGMLYWVVRVSGSILRSVSVFW